MSEILLNEAISQRGQPMKEANEQKAVAASVASRVNEAILDLLS